MLVVKLTHIPSQQVTSDIPNAEYGRWRQKRIPPFGSHSESKAKKKKKINRIAFNCVFLPTTTYARGC